MTDLPINEPEHSLPPGVVIIPGLTPQTRQHDFIPLTEISVDAPTYGIDFASLRKIREQNHLRDIAAGKSSAYLDHIEGAFVKYRFPLESPEFHQYQAAINPARTWDLEHKPPNSGHNLALRETSKPLLAQLGLGIIKQNIAKRFSPQTAAFLSSWAEKRIEYIVDGFNPDQSSDPAENIELRGGGGGAPFGLWVWGFFAMDLDPIWSLKSAKESGLPPEVFSEIRKAWNASVEGEPSLADEAYLFYEITQNTI